MSEALRLEMTPRQKELMLRGLRYVYSAVALEVYDPTPDNQVERRNELAEISELTNLLNPAERGTKN
jgi:hypothetical protein